MDIQTTELIPVAQIASNRYVDKSKIYSNVMISFFITLVVQIYPTTAIFIANEVSEFKKWYIVANYILDFFPFFTIVYIIISVHNMHTYDIMSISHQTAIKILLYVSAACLVIIQILDDIYVVYN